MSRPWERIGAQGSGQFPMTQTQLERINMDPFDKLVADITSSSSLFAMGGRTEDIKAGIAALGAWKKDMDAWRAAMSTPATPPPPQPE